MELRQEIASALNQHCAENRSNTPDFILARYLIGCLNAFDVAVNEREQWYGRENTLPPRKVSCSLCRDLGSVITDNSFTPCPNCSAVSAP